jgi:hypothetical protein
MRTEKVQVIKSLPSRVSQGDIYKEIEYIESVEEVRNDNQIEVVVSRIKFPFVIVLTQDCDLDADARCRAKAKPDQLLLSAIVAPIYDYTLLCAGKHLEGLEFGNPKTNIITDGIDYPPFFVPVMMRG